jgi:hypothetical protein
MTGHATTITTYIYFLNTLRDTKAHAPTIVSLKGIVCFRCSILSYSGKMGNNIFQQNDLIKQSLKMTVLNRPLPN